MKTAADVLFWVVLFECWFGHLPWWTLGAALLISTVIYVYIEKEKKRRQKELDEELKKYAERLRKRK